MADSATLVWTLLIMALLSFAIGFRLHDGVGNAVAALALVYGFAFEWAFIAVGLYASNAQAAQGIGLLLVPLTFVSSAHVPISSMLSWLRTVAENQPMTFIVDAVLSLTGGARAEVLLGHPASYFIGSSLIWSAAITVVFGAIAIARYRRG